MRKSQARARSKSLRNWIWSSAKEYRFQPGRSGNPAGINRKTSHSTAPDLRASLQRELNKKIVVPCGETERVTTQAEAGISELVRQFAKVSLGPGVICWLWRERVDIDLAPGKTIENALAEALSAEDEALLADFVRRHGGQYPLNSNSAEGANLPHRRTGGKTARAALRKFDRSQILQDEELSDE